MWKYYCHRVLGFLYILFHLVNLLIALGCLYILFHILANLTFRRAKPYFLFNFLSMQNKLQLNFFCSLAHSMYLCVFPNIVFFTCFHWSINVLNHHEQFKWRINIQIVSHQTIPPPSKPSKIIVGFYNPIRKDLYCSKVSSVKRPISKR